MCKHLAKTSILFQLCASVHIKHCKLIALFVMTLLIVFFLKSVSGTD